MAVPYGTVRYRTIADCSRALIQSSTLYPYGTVPGTGPYGTIWQREILVPTNMVNGNTCQHRDLNLRRHLVKTYNIRPLMVFFKN